MILDRVDRFLDAFERLVVAVEKLAGPQKRFRVAKRDCERHRKRVREPKLTSEEEAILERLMALPDKLRRELVRLALQNSPIRSADPEDEAVEKFDEARLRSVARPLIHAGLLDVPKEEGS